MAGVEADGARLDLFGGFRLTANGMPVGVSSRRARGLIAYLCAMRDGSAARERLAGLLWSDRGEEQARASLRQCLLEIKAALNGTGCELIDLPLKSLMPRIGVGWNCAESIHAGCRLFCYGAAPQSLVARVPGAAARSG